MATLSLESASFSNECDSITVTSVTNEPNPSLVSARESTSSEHFELLQIQKLFQNLSESQQRFFISNLLNNFSSNFLRNLNFTLQSLNHKDFDYKINVNRVRPPPRRPTYANIPSRRNSNHLIIPQTPYNNRRNSILTDKSFPKLPSIIETVNKQGSNKASRETEKSKVSREGGDVGRRRPSIIVDVNSNNGTVMETSRSQLRSRKHVPIDIERFALSKSLDVIETPWTLNQVTSRYFSESKLQENTDNLVQKLKSLFQEKYIKSKESVMFVDLHKEAEARQPLEEANKSTKQQPEVILTEDASLSESKNNFLQTSSVNLKNQPENGISALLLQVPNQHSRDSFRESESRARSRNKSRRHGRGSLSMDQQRRSSILKPEELKSIYMKKLQNNFYDRKLWNTLESSNKQETSYNFYVDGLSRDYSHEFSILGQSDWTDSIFAQNLSRYSEKMADLIREKKGSEYYDFLDGVSTAKHSAATNQTNWARELNKSQLTTYQKSIQKVYKSIKLKNLKQSMNFLPTVKRWSNVEKQQLILVLLEVLNKSNLEFLRDAVKNKTKPIYANMNHLPDNVLLNIFAHLDLDTLDNVEHVCQRWSFLAHTPELWLFKCKKLCERERLGQVGALITEASLATDEIDWKQAFIEISEFTASESVRQVRLSYLQSLKANAKAVRPRNINLLKEEMARKKLRRRVTVNTSNSACDYENFYIKPDDFEIENELLKESSYLTHLTLQTLRNENGKKKKKEPHPYLSDVFEYKLAHSDQTFRPVNIDKNKPYFKYSENADEVLRDFKEIKTELVPTKDLMNPAMPNYRLKWKNEDEELKPFETVVHNLSTITKVQSLNNHRKKITCIDYDKNRVVTGSLDQLIFVYDFKKGTCLGKLEGHKGGIKCVYILKNRLCSGSWDMQLIIWNMIRFEMVTALNVNQDSISCIYFDMKYLIYGSHDKKINVWQFNPGYTESGDASTTSLKAENVVNFDKLIEHHKSGVTCLTYDGINCIVSANTQGSVLLIDINGILLRQLNFTSHFEPITSMKLVGALIIAATAHGKVVFWNRRNNKLESIIKCNEDETPVYAVSYYNKRFYTAGNDRLVKEWDMASLTCIRQFKAHEGPVFDMVVAEDKIISCGYDKAIIWNMNTKKEVNIMTLSESGR